MSNKRNPIIDPGQPMIYQIRIKGHLGPHLAGLFEHLTIRLEDNGDTLLTGPVVDQAALHGLLKKVRDFGMPLVSVNPVEFNETHPYRSKRRQTMNTNRKTTTNEGGKLANTNRQTTIKTESKMKLTASKLIRWAGLPAMAAGIIFIVIQPIHPPDVLSSVTTSTWAIVTALKTAMCLLGLLGITGLYARQAEKAGWLGLAGYLLFSLFFALTLPFAFAEAFILPLLATDAPKFVESILGLASGATGGVNLGALAVVYRLAGFLGYIFGGLLFGIATLRAGVLPRWAAGLLAFAAVSVLAGALLPHPLDRILAVPMGLALIWLGYSLLSERRKPASELLPSIERPQLSQTGAD